MEDIGGRVIRTWRLLVGVLDMEAICGRVLRTWRLFMTEYFRHGDYWWESTSDVEVTGGRVLWG